MFALWNLGHAIEGLLGSRAFLVVYLGSAVAGNLTGFVMDRTWTMSMGSSSEYTSQQSCSARRQSASSVCLSVALVL